METQNNYQNDIIKYNNLKNYVSNIITELSNAIAYLNSIDNNVKNKYSVDDEYTPIESRINTLMNNMANTRNYLRDTILPAIDNAVTGTNQKIASSKNEK